MTADLPSLSALAGLFNWFFHAPESPRTLAVFRIAFGVLLTVESIGLLKTGSEVFGSYGFAGHGVPAKSASHINLFRLASHHPDSWIGMVFVMHTVSCVFLAAGLLTKPAALLVFLNFASRSKQNWYVIQGGDNVAKFMSFLLIFSNAGATLSLDARFQLPMFGATALDSSQWPQKLMQIQVSIIYLRTALWKLKQRNWIDGTAVFHALYRNPHSRWHPLPTRLSRGPAIALATWVTLAMEIAGGTLIWFRETRFAVLAALVGLHLSMEVFLRLKSFQWIMLVCLILFVPSNGPAIA